MQAESVWNSLEVVKLVTGLLTPITIAGIGVYIHRVTKRFENRQWVNQRVVEKRLELYDSMAPLFNDILCYFTFVGCWKEIDPPEMIVLKRNLDKKIYLASPLFPPSFFEACKSFQDTCFSTFNNWGEDAKLRILYERRVEAHKKPWKQDWYSHFSNDPSTPKDVQNCYKAVMAEFANSLGDLDFTSSYNSSNCLQILDN